MIERRLIDLSEPEGSEARITSLTDVAARPWSGVVQLPAGAALAPSGAARVDVFLLRGSVRDTHGSRLETGDFASGPGMAGLLADDGPAVLLIYRESSAPVLHGRRVSVSARAWRAARASSMDVAVLSDDGHRVSLVRWRPGARIAPHGHRNGEEILVLEGELRSGEERYPPGTWMRMYSDSMHAPFTTTSTLILLRNGHLKPSPIAHDT